MCFLYFLHFPYRYLTTTEADENARNWWREKIESMTGDEKENQIVKVFGSQAIYEEQCPRGKKPSKSAEPTQEK